MSAHLLQRRKPAKVSTDILSTESGGCTGRVTGQYQWSCHSGLFPLPSVLPPSRNLKTRLITRFRDAGPLLSGRHPARNDENPLEWPTMAESQEPDTDTSNFCICAFLASSAKLASMLFNTSCLACCPVIPSASASASKFSVIYPPK